MHITLTLADYPDDMVWIECNKCGRLGRLSSGPAVALPDLRHTLAAGFRMASQKGAL
jgi:hypothetical protein